MRIGTLPILEMEHLRRWYKRGVKNPARDSSSLTTTTPRRKTFPSGIKLLHKGKNIVVE